MPEDIPGDKRRKDSKETDGRGSTIWGNQHDGIWVPQLYAVVLDWPKSWFEFLHSILWKILMNVLTNPT